MAAIRTNRIREFPARPLTNAAPARIIKLQLHTGGLGVSRLRWREATRRTLEPDAGNADVGSQTKDAVGFYFPGVLSAFRMQIPQNQRKGMHTP